MVGDCGGGEGGGRRTGGSEICKEVQEASVVHTTRNECGSFSEITVSRRYALQPHRKMKEVLSFQVFPVWALSPT